MRALLFATGHTSPEAQFSLRHSPPLLPLVDRPFLQHVVEALVRLGARELDVVLADRPEAYEALLGDGSRWGCRVTVHLARDPARPWAAAGPVLAAGPGGRVLLARGDTLPALEAPLPDGEGARLFCAPGDGTWTGWAFADVRDLAAVPADADDAECARLLTERGAERRPVSALLRATSYTDLLAAQHQALGGGFPGLLLGGHPAAEGVWLSRNVSLHPTVALQPPVFIGPDCRIGPGLSLGPDAVVGAGCILDRRCLVAGSAILPGSYVGEMLEVRDCVVDRNLLVNTHIGGAVRVSDDFILGSADAAGLGGGLDRLLSRLTGALLLAFLFPLLLGVTFALLLGRRGPLLVRREAVRLPAGDDPAEWRTIPLCAFAGPDGLRGAFPWLRHFLLVFLPGLVHVAQGRLRLVGVAPRAAEELRALPPDWQALVRSAEAGLVDEARVVYGPSPSPDDRYSAEAFQVAAAGPRHAARLLAAYLARLLRRA